MKMAKTAIVNLVLMCLASAAGMARAQDLSSCLFSKTARSVAYIHYTFSTESDGDGGDKGSGVLINSSGFILTNAHVVSPPTNAGKPTSSEIIVRLGSLSAQPSVAKLVHIDQDLDLALLKIPPVASRPAVLSTTDNLAVGSRLYALGFPGADLTVVSGQRSAARAVSADVSPRWLQTTLPLNGGNSGGPVYGALGTVVGIATAKKIDSQLQTYVIPISEAKAFIADIPTVMAEVGSCATCRDKSHGVERYRNEFEVTEQSGWMGGGHSQPEWCATVIQRQVSRDAEAAVSVLTSSEMSESKCSPFNCPQYNYSCTVLVKTAPIYALKSSAACANK